MEVGLVSSTLLLGERRCERVVSGDFCGGETLRLGPDRRLEVLHTDPHRDAERMWQVHQAEEAWRATLAELGPQAPGRAAALEVRWMLEEYRVSLWAQTRGTAYPISDTRIRKALDAA